MTSRVTAAGVPIIIGGDNGVITGSDADEWIFGTDGDDTIDGVGGDNIIIGGDGNDDLRGGDGDDLIVGGAGDDRLSGGGGNDVLVGGSGSNTFVLSTAEGDAGEDTIVDFTSNDTLAFNAAALVRDNPDIDLRDGAAALDELDQFSVTIANDDDDNDNDNDNDNDDNDDDNGNDNDNDNDTPDDGTVDLVITTPAGTTTLLGVDLDELGLDRQNLSMEALENANLLTIENFIEGSGNIEGTENDDVIIGSDGDDTITGRGGDDIMTGGGGSNQFVFDPSNPDEGDDVITDFTVPTSSPIGDTLGDYISLNSEQVLAASPDLAAADGDASTLTLADFDADPTEAWSIEDSDDGYILINHPGGSIELQGLQAENLTFEAIGPLLLVDGEPFPEEGIAIENGNDVNGEDDDDNNDVVDDVDDAADDVADEVDDVAGDIDDAIANLDDQITQDDLEVA
jgi:Ca2+-binding RTX toxin-like protein